MKEDVSPKIQDNSIILDDLEMRTINFRQRVIPWLNEAKPLHGAKILEIGCGAGSSTIALAEQGAKITAVDISESALRRARERCAAKGLHNIDFVCANATEVHKIFADREFDFILFFACLEHMTHKERLSAMHETWNMLSTGNLWCVIDTPNRLWYFDAHTSLLPFYSWLPDELALMYAQFSPRQNFCNLFPEYTDEKMLHFLRLGRGVSFHEFDLAIKKVTELNIVSSLSSFLIDSLKISNKKISNRFKNFIPLRWREEMAKLLKSPNTLPENSSNLSKTPDPQQYISFLEQVEPNIDRGFYQPSLDLIIRKD